VRVLRGEDYRGLGVSDPLRTFYRKRKIKHKIV